MKILRDASTPSDPEKLLDDLLQRPLFAHLSTVHEEGPRESPVWFLWENKEIWILGNTRTDSFPARIESEPRCALGIVDFNPATGLVQHAGIRGWGSLLAHDRKRVSRLFCKYMGAPEHWDSRFTKVLGDPAWVLVRISPETVVVRDQSYDRI